MLPMPRHSMDHAQDFKGPEVVSFGPFSVIAAQRKLLREGVALTLGGRAMDVLMALVARAGEVVGKGELMARAWPGRVVSEESLRFQITALRKALGDGHDGARYIANVAGRGYCFVAEIVAGATPKTGAAPAGAHDVASSLPATLEELVGRADDLRALSERLADRRFVTIVGPGGVGKTTVAVRAGHDRVTATGSAAVFVDLAALSDPGLVPTAVASMLRLSVQSADPVPNLLAYLRDKRLLLILDNCEHVIEAAALLSERIFQAAPEVRLIATSREPLRAHGEHVYRLEPLATPPNAPGLTAEDVLKYPAARLFVARAGASGANLDLSDTDAALVAAICRKLDGVALAIELAARRVASYGLHQTAALLDERLALSWHGQRTAQPRHRTLQATLDWSFDLLDDAERLVLCQLPVFAGDFTLEAARQVAEASSLGPARVVAAIESLVEKSLIAVQRSDGLTMYRLLESTRSYAQSKSGEELQGASLRHALYFRHWLEDVAARDGTFISEAGRASDVAHMGNARAALAWCFGRGDAADLGIAIASAAVPAFLAMSLLAECRQWSERALEAMTDETRGGVWEMQLQAAHGLSQMFTHGNSERVRRALQRSLEIARLIGDARSQVQLLGRLQIFHERIGEFEESLRHARNAATVAEGIEDRTARATADSLVGLCNHLTGDQNGARLLLEAAIAESSDSEHASTTYLGFDHRNRARIALARTLWLLGYPDQAVAMAMRAVEEARGLNHPVTFCIALIWAVSIHLWIGDYAQAEGDIDRFIATAEVHSLTPYRAVGRGIKGELALRRGAPETGVRAIEECLVELHELRYELLTTNFNLTRAEGLIAIGNSAEALRLIDDTLQQVRASGELYNLPELLRVKAQGLLSAPRPEVALAQACLLEAIEHSRHQGARAWELRATTDLAKTYHDAGRTAEAIVLLGTVLGHFGEGFETRDLKAARGLRDRLKAALPAA